MTGSLNVVVGIITIGIGLLFHRRLESGITSAVELALVLLRRTVTVAEVTRRLLLDGRLHFRLIRGRGGMILMGGVEALEVVMDLVIVGKFCNCYYRWEHAQMAGYL